MPRPLYNPTSTGELMTMVIDGGPIETVIGTVTLGQEWIGSILASNEDGDGVWLTPDWDGSAGLPYDLADFEGTLAGDVSGDASDFDETLVLTGDLEADAAVYRRAIQVVLENTYKQLPAHR